MQGGRVVEYGPIADVLDHPRDAYTRRLIESIPKPGWKPRQRTWHRQGALPPRQP
jgi:ABC-type dipeptide/oligopeptide/nickel transport system ATPase component